ncbi:nucleotidyl transferase AbiEii/AbiGii toxin family protein [Alkalibacterium sp. MB6]|uniref:nucleotidyl transferase AbiEii/AbiGii toxin family protein n=1 Tax=Alkalibacterium sp. MB6 TaxID=2081965 RepID=UPI00137AEBF3|nr:nucleotidyl transferase AbiEii/AbiGii toxin family protein [Alkalibacterium sp. MB6]
MRNAVQLNAKVKHLATEKGLTHEVVLRNYMLERFLERISQSKYRSHVILKGGMLISSMVGIETRTTMDLDASLKGLTLSESEIIPIH